MTHDPFEYYQRIVGLEKSNMLRFEEAPSQVPKNDFLLEQNYY
jgi:hypothetical protein